MAAVKKRNYASYKRVSPIKPGIRGAKNWAAAKVRGAGHTRKGFVRFTMSLVAVLLCVSFLALWLGGFLPQVQQSISDFKRDRLMAAGFVVQQVDVMGEGRMSEADVRQVIGISPGDYFFGADLKAAQQNTESLPWVDRAVVRRLWPNRIVVQLVETEPYAVWQNGGKFSLVSAGGEAIYPLEDAPSAGQGLIVLTGVDAPNLAYVFEKDLREFPQIWNRVEAMTHLPSGRWDLFLEGDVKVRLPKANHQVALTNLSRLQDSQQILDRQIGVIDLRLADRLTLRAVVATSENKGA